MTRSWGHGIAKANRRQVPELSGTPGRANSRAVAGGVFCGSSSTPRFFRCTIANNAVLSGDESPAHGGGVTLRGSSNSVLESCVIGEQLV